MEAATELIEELARCEALTQATENEGMSSARLPQSIINDLAAFFRPWITPALSATDVSMDASVQECSAFWSLLAGSRVQLSLLVGALRQAMEQRVEAQTAAAASYLGMLLAPSCPLYSTFDTLAFLALLRVMQQGSGPIGAGAVGTIQPPARRRGKKQRAAPVTSLTDASDEEELDSEVLNQAALTQDQMDTDRSIASVSAATSTPAFLVGLKALLSKLRFADQPESRKVLIDTLCELPRCALQHSDREALADAAYAALLQLFEPQHGMTLDTGVAVMRALTPSLLLTFESAGKAPEAEQGRPARRGANEQAKARAAVRERAIKFVSRDLRDWARDHEQITAGSRGGHRSASCSSGPTHTPRQVSGQEPVATPKKGAQRAGSGSPVKDVRLVVAAVLRHLSLKAAELKADGKALAVDAICCIAGQLDAGDVHRFAEFVLRLSRNAKVSLRQFAVEVALGLLTQLPDPFSLDTPVPCASPVACTPLLSPLPDQGASPAPRLSIEPPPVSWPLGALCLTALLQRCSDKAPQVRSKALANLAVAWDCIWVEVRQRPLLLELLGLQEPAAGAPSTPRLNAWNMVGRSPTPLTGTASPMPSAAQPGVGASPLTPGAGYSSLGPLLRRRCGDAKAAVRKAALSMMEQLIRAGGTAPDLSMSSSTLLHPTATPLTHKNRGLGAFPTADDLSVMEAACGDSALSVRRAALSALSQVVRTWPTDAAVANAWAQAVLPMVADTEQTVQDRCLDLFEELVLERVAHAGGTVVPPQGSARAAGDEAVPKEVATILRALSSQASCVTRLCSLLAKKGRVKAGVAKALQRVIIVAERWGTGLARDRHGGTDSPAPRGAWLLLSEVAAHTPAAVSWEFLQSRWEKLGKAGAESSSAAAEDRGCLLKTIVNVAARFPQAAASQLATELLGKLSHFELDPSDVGPHLEALVVLSERSSTEEMQQWAADLLSKAESLLNAYVLDRAVPHLPDAALGDRPEVPSEPSVASALFTVGALVQSCSGPLPGRLVTRVQSLVAAQPGRLVTRVQSLVAAQPGQHEVSQVTAHAWTALGKLCLADELLAKKCMPLLVQELEVSTSPAVRNNIMVAMADLCVRYTALVDSSIGRLAACLRDPCELVRRQTLLLFASLLQREYVKWRGPLFHRFLRALVDESVAVRSLADFLFKHVLAVKAPLLAYNHFVEALSVLNDCEDHHSETVRASSCKERELFAIKGTGASAHSQRMVIYRALLSCMAPEHRFATTAKLCAEVLGGVAEGSLPLSGCEGMLLDALKVLCCKEIKVGAKARGEGDEDAPEDDASGANAAANAAKGRLVSQLMKKNLMEHVVPILIELKRVLEGARSPLLGPLMECIRGMLKEYKAELEDIFAADKQLAKEILYDIQKHEAAAKAAKAAAAAARLATPVPGPPATSRAVGSMPRASTNSWTSSVARGPERVAASPARVEGQQGPRRSALHSSTPRPEQRAAVAGDDAGARGRERDSGEGSPMQSTPQAKTPSIKLAGSGGAEGSFEFQVPQGMPDLPTPQQTKRLSHVFEELAVNTEDRPEAGYAGGQEASFGGRTNGPAPDASGPSGLSLPQACFAGAFLSPLRAPQRTPGARATLASPLPHGTPRLVTGTPARTPDAAPFSSPAVLCTPSAQAGGAATPSLRAMSVPQLRPGATRWAERQGTGVAATSDSAKSRLGPALARDREAHTGHAGGSSTAVDDQENRVALPSPLPVRLYAPGAAPGDSQGKADVFLFSPDQPLPPLRQWNVQLPGEQGSRKRQHKTPSKGSWSTSPKVPASPSPLRDLQNKRPRLGLQP